MRSEQQQAVYNGNVMRQELAKADYDGMTANQAWDWLMGTHTPDPVTTVTGRLTPLTVAAVIGPAKAEAIATAMKQVFPITYTFLLDSGIDPSNESAVGFLQSLVQANIITADDITAMTAAVSTTTTFAPFRRFDSRFHPESWPHLDNDGNVGSESDQAIDGFPNTVERSMFDAAWTASGRII